MNKRQKKKQLKKKQLQEKDKIERYSLDYNYEGYRDPTAALAIKNATKRGY